MKKLALPLLAFVLFFGNCHSTAIKNRSDEKPADVAKTPRTDTVLEQEYYDFYNSIHLLPATMAVNAERIYIQRYNQMKDSTPIIFSKEDSLYMMKQITRWPDGCSWQSDKLQTSRVLVNDSINAISKSIRQDKKTGEFFGRFEYIRLSIPIFSKDKQWCICSVSYYCIGECEEEGKMYIYKKIKGTWVLMFSTITWIT